MQKAKVKVWRYNQESNLPPGLQEYQVCKQPGDTVLQALLEIYENIDSTLAFRYGCRNKHCGLCGVEVDGKPRLACLSRLRDNTTVKPLRNLPVIRDLVIDRSWLIPVFDRLEMYVPPGEERTPQVVTDPVEHTRLLDCIECLCCLSTCPYYHYEDVSFGGPYLFLKLAQLHFHPRNTIDRVAQAASLGISRCATCRICRCAIGIPLYQYAIAPLLCLI